MEVHEDSFLSQPILNPRKSSEQRSRSSSDLRKPLSHVNSNRSNHNQTKKKKTGVASKRIVKPSVIVERETSVNKDPKQNVSSSSTVLPTSRNLTAPKTKPNVNEKHVIKKAPSSTVGRTFTRPKRTTRNFVGRAQRVVIDVPSVPDDSSTAASTAASSATISAGTTSSSLNSSSLQASPLTQRQVDLRAFIQQQRDAKKELLTREETEEKNVGSTSYERKEKDVGSTRSETNEEDVGSTLQGSQKEATMFGLTKTTRNDSSGMSLRDFIQSQRDNIKQPVEGGGSKYECLAMNDSVDLLALDSSFSLSDPDEEEEKDISLNVQPDHGTAQDVLVTSHPQTPTKSSGFFVELNKGPKLKKKAPSTPLLSLGNFQESLWLDFGSEQQNIVGKPRSLPFVLGVRQSDPKPLYRVTVERVPTQKGFDLHFEAGTSNCSGTEDDTDVTTLYIPKGGSHRFNVTWTPVEAGGVREVIYLKLQFGRVRVVVVGHAREVIVPKRRRKVVRTAKHTVNSSVKKIESPTKPKNAVTKKRVTNSGSPQKVKLKNATSNVVAGDGKRIQEKKVISRSKLSPKRRERKQVECSNTVSSNKSWGVYDNVWADKQCVSFGKWLNHMFQPPDEILEYEQMTREENADMQNLDRPTLRSLLLNRRRAQARHRANAFYNGSHMDTVKNAIASEVNTSRMSLRTDNDVLANVRLRSQIISILLSYSTSWLRLGLETVFNETITTDIAAKTIAKELEVRKNLGIKGPSQIAKPTMKRTLKEFILQRVLSDPIIKMKYTKGKCKIPSGRFEKMYKNEMRQHFLKHILLLIVFLDGAKVNSIIKSSPRLFNKKGIIKSSKEFLAILCRDYLHGIGNVFKHLGSVGVTVTYEQRYIEELDYVVSNLATDLRDGIRLTKLAEILRGQNDDSLVGQLRLPAVSRLQKLHNTDCALTFFDEIGIPNIASIQASHIIEGHRPQVLKLLWSIMSSYKLSTLLHPKELMHEIEGIYTSRRYTGAPKEVTFKEGGDICELLLQWCQAVCSCFQYDVKDFSNSFSDGTALGLIIHYYHPAILNREHILPTTSSLKTRGLSVSKSDEFEAALGNERRNCKFANDAMLEIGGIPNMFPLSDTINIPDERTTIICVAYLCSRLLELRTETLAATVIQKAFRKFVGPLNKQKMRNAVLKVEKFWIDNKDCYFAAQRDKYQDAVFTIEAFFSSKLKALQRERELRTMNGSVGRIQCFFRGYSTRKWLDYETRSATSIQQMWRKYNSNKTSIRREQAVLVIQCATRQWLAVRQLISIWENMDYQHRVESAAITCQALIRKKIARMEFLSEIKKYRSATLIQNAYRRFRDTKSYQLTHTEIVKIQSFVRGFLNRYDIDNQHKNATRIQALWRAFSEQRQFEFVISDIILVQSVARRNLAKSQALERYNSIIKIQCMVRCLVSRIAAQALHQSKAYEAKLLKAVVSCQANVRRNAARKEYFSTLNHNRSALVIQTLFRRHAACSNLHNKLSAVCKIQAIYRSYSTKKNLEHLSNSAVTIQKIWRRYAAHLQFQFDLSDIVFVQSLVRRKLAQSIIQNRHHAILKIQCHLRQCLCRRELHRLKSETTQFNAATMVQKTFRRYKALLNFKQIQENDFYNKKVILVQSIWRGHFVRIQVRRTQAAVLIQKNWRCYVQNVDFVITVISAIKIQAFSRQAMARIKFEGKKTAAILIQRRIRGMLKRNLVRRYNQNSSIIQKWWRNILSDRIRCKAITAVQSAARGMLVRKSIRTQIEAACSIQKLWRGYRTNVDYLLTMLTVIRLQAIFRGSLARRKATSLRLKMEELALENRKKAKAATVIQQAYRLALGKKLMIKNILLIQKVWRGFCFRRKCSKLLGSITKLQAIFRGYQVRKLSSQGVLKAALKITQANRTANENPQMILGSRTSAALLVLQTSKRLTEIMDALRTLEVSTRLSPKCCMAFTNEQAHRILYNLVRSCNRSLPHVELLQTILRTLSNVMKYQRLIEGNATLENTEILLDLIQMFRDKETIFYLTARLLKRIVFSADKYIVLCKKRENMKRINGVYTLSKKKSVSMKSRAGATSRSKDKISMEMQRGVHYLEQVLQKLHN